MHMNTQISLFLKKHKIAVLIFLIALLVRSLLFFVNFNYENYDLISTIKGDDGYYELSRGILLGHGFSWDAEPPFSPNPLRPPVYPFFIAGLLYFFGSYSVVLCVQILLGSIIPVLGMMLIEKVVSSKKVAIAVGLFLALEPSSVLLSSIFYTETVFMVLFFISLLFFFDYFKNPTYRNIIWGSLFLGLSTLTKPTVQYLPVVIPLFILWHFRKNITKKVFIHVALFVGIFIITISPWLYRNYKEFGVVGISAQPAFNLYVYLVPSVLSVENQTGFHEEWEKFVRKDGFDEMTITLTNSDYFIQRSIEVLKEYPVSFMKLSVSTVVTFFTHDGMLTVLQHAGYTPDSYLSKPALFLILKSPGEFFSTAGSYITSPFVLVLIMRLIWLIITITAILGAIQLLISRRINTLSFFAIFLIAYFAATSIVGGLGVNIRHRIPINLFIVMFSLLWCSNLLRRVKTIGRKINVSKVA